MRRRSGVVAFTAAILLSLLVVVAPNASAGNCTDTWFGRLCGTVQLYKGNVSRSISISDNWPATNGRIRTLFPGQSSTMYYADTDAIKPPSGCRLVTPQGQVFGGGIWHKIRDGQVGAVEIWC